MATKKEIDKIFFRLDWWQYLRWKSPELIAEVMSRFMNHCSGMEPIDIDENTKPQNEAETFLFPMVLQFERDKASYDEACRQNAANVSKRWNKKKNETQEDTPEETPADTTEYDQENRNTTKYDRNTNEYDQENRNTKKGIERKGKEKNIFFFSADEETSPDGKKEKKEILKELTFHFIERGVLKPYTAAEKAWDYNESNDWKTVTTRGKSTTTKDHSKNKLAFLRGWDVEGMQYSLDGAKVFSDFCRATELEDPSILDDFHGAAYMATDNGAGMVFFFNRKDTCVKFRQYFGTNPQFIETGNETVRQTYRDAKGFLPQIYKQA